MKRVVVRLVREESAAAPSCPTAVVRGVTSRAAMTLRPLRWTVAASLLAVGGNRIVLTQDVGNVDAATYDSRGIALAERGDLQGAMAAFLDAMRITRPLPLPGFISVLPSALRSTRRGGRGVHAGPAARSWIAEARYSLSSACATIGDRDGAITLLVSW